MSNATEPTQEPAESTEPKKPEEKRRQGFNVLTDAQKRAISSMGGKVAQERGVAHRYDSAEGAAAGRLGGLAVSQNRAYMAEIGRRGGLAGRRQGD